MQTNNANEILFRCSSLGYLMTDPTGKSAEEKYNDAVDSLKKLEEEYSLTANKETKTAKAKAEKISDLKKSVPFLKASIGEINLSETTITHLIDLYVSNKYNRHTEIKSKYLVKGTEVEDKSIDIVSVITGDFYTKNEERLSNEYIQGCPDIFLGKEILKAKKVRDTKSSWDVFTFNRSIRKKLNPIYYWQGQGYMWLTGATEFSVDYCLNSTPYHLVQKELQSESYNYPENDTPAWVELMVIANHVYDKKTFDEYINLRGCHPNDENSHAVYAGFVEIPLEERHFNFDFKRNDDDIDRLRARIMQCRIYMNNNLFKTLKVAA